MDMRLACGSLFETLHVVKGGLPARRKTGTMFDRRELRPVEKHKFPRGHGYSYVSSESL
jgi:hypothetical protein